jgi:dephospho-CoA kinase
MLKVGLTGNIASGKSTVADNWRNLGALIVDSDELARRAVEPGSAVLARVAERWGPEVLLPSGELDRGALRDRVFRDPAERAALEAMIHPRVAELRDEEFRRAEEQGARIVVADVPLLFEAGLASEFDLVVLVDAPESVRRDRIVSDRGLDPAEADRMIAAQMPATGKRHLADIVIDNTGSLEDLRADAERVWGEIRRRVETPA